MVGGMVSQGVVFAASLCVWGIRTSDRLRITDELKPDAKKQACVTTFSKRPGITRAQRLT